MLVNGHSAPAESGTLTKAASGGLEQVPYLRIGNPAETPARLGKEGILVIGLDIWRMCCCRLRHETMARPICRRLPKPPHWGYKDPHAPVAQLDRAPPSEGGGQRFESSRVRHF